MTIVVSDNRGKFSVLDSHSKHANMTYQQLLHLHCIQSGLLAKATELSLANLPHSSTPPPPPHINSCVDCTAECTLGNVLANRKGCKCSCLSLGVFSCILMLQRKVLAEESSILHYTTLAPASSGRLFDCTNIAS